MLQFYYKAAKEDVFTVLSSPKDGCWIHVEEPTSFDLQEITELTNLELVDIQDALDRYELPRVEKIQNSELIFARHPIEVSGGLFTTTLTIILTSNYFITISPSTNHLIKNFIFKKNKFATAQRSKMLIHLLLQIMQEFTLQIRRVRHSVSTQEKEMIYVESEDISRLTRQEEVLNQYLSSMVPLRGVIETLSSGKVTIFHDKEFQLLEDVFHDLRQAEDLCNIVVKSIRSLRDSYQIIFTNNLNRTIKLLTALTALFSIPTMIASLYGMNVPLPLSGTAHAFFYLVAIIVILLSACLYYFYRKRWL